MAKTTCPKCDKKIRFTKCNNCNADKHSIIAGWVGQNYGVSCSKCGYGITQLNCDCGCVISGSKFEDGDFWFGGTETSIN